MRGLQSSPPATSLLLTRSDTIPTPSNTTRLPRAPRHIARDFGKERRAILWARFGGGLHPNRFRAMGRKQRYRGIRPRSVSNRGIQQRAAMDGRGRVRPRDTEQFSRQLLIEGRYKDGFDYDAMVSKTTEGIEDLTIGSRM